MVLNIRVVLTERVYYQCGALKTYNILRVPHVIEHVTLGGILGKMIFWNLVNI